MNKPQSERRRAPRISIQEIFSLFAVVPEKGFHRLVIHDINKLGIGFDLDAEGEPFEIFQIKENQILDIRFYLNQSLYIPLKTRIVRIQVKGAVRKVGAEFTQTNNKCLRALGSFLDALDQINPILQEEEIGE